MLIVADLLVAMLVVHWPRGFFSQGGGIEFTFVLVGASIAIALLGFGSWSADAVIGVVVPAWLTLAALALAIVAVVISLLVRNGSSRSAAT
jgi:hypothetical protein